MKVLVMSENHDFLNGVDNQPPDVTKKVQDAVVDYIVKEFGVKREKIYAPIFQDRATLVTMIRKTNTQDVFFEENQWGLQDPFMQEALQKNDDVEIKFGVQGNLFIAWFEEIDALDRSGMRTSPIEKDDHLMTMEEWVACCESGGFINYDGFGRYSDGKVEYNEEVYPSYTKTDRVDKTFSHVVWYNR